MAEQEIPGIELEYVFSIRIDFKERINMQGPRRDRVYVPPIGGDIWGPKLQGRVVPYSGADFASGGLLNAHYMLQADDGTWIYINNMGYLYARDGSGTRLDDPSWGGDRDYYFRLTPYFDAPHGPHEWLNDTVILGTGQRHANPDHTIFTYYAVL
ncbi:MAG: DUF3237 domain-containing protein [Gammaproteobacteria bacterium]|nr:DUF3237 domain-containing protein [Gammaproteobacteria bacterium]